jgi:type I restriction enzyme, S subunit
MITASKPSGWIWTNLGNFLEFAYGKSLPEKARSGKGFPVFGSNGIVGYHDSPLTRGETLIIGRKGSVGEVNYSPEPCFPIDTTYYIEQFFGTPAKFWYYLLKYTNLAVLNKATAIPGLNREDVYRVNIPVPPLNEQKRIAAKLDNLFVRLDSCQSHLERVPQILQRYRESVLAVATSGQLTKDWRKKRGLALDSWETKTGSDVFPFITSGSRGWAGFYANSGSKFIRVGNLDHNTIELDLKDIQYVKPPLSAEGRRTRIKVGDILISITADVGMVGFVRKDIGEAYINQHICLARQTGNYIGEYLAYFLASPVGGLSQLVNAQKGMTKAGLTLGDIRAITFQIPGKEEQQEIVSLVERLFAYAERLEVRYQLSHKLVEQLTPSLLAKAFHGELVEQDSKDEPAEKLLELIIASRIAEEMKRRVKLSQKKKVKVGKKSELKTLYETLKEAGVRLTPEDLFRNAGYDENTVNEFFEELRTEIKKKRIREIRSGSQDVYLKG